MLGALPPSCTNWGPGFPNMDIQTHSLAVLLVLALFLQLQHKPETVTINHGLLLVNFCRWWRRQRGHQESYLHTW